MATNGNMEIIMTSPKGVLLKTAGKYCETDITITPNIESGGGEQPQLFAPIVTADVNKISWGNDTRNGGFSVDITGTIDGETVTSPLRITEDMNGKTLTVTASADKFESGPVSFPRWKASRS